MAETDRRITRDSNMARIMPDTDTAAINLIGEGSEVEGILRSSTDVRVNGRVVGEVNVEGKVIVADKGLIDGTLVAGSADIAGTVTGDLKVSERLLLKSTARVEGTIKTARLVVEEGAVFDGQCDMGRLDKERKARIENGTVAAKPPEKPREDLNKGFVLESPKPKAG